MTFECSTRRLGRSLALFLLLAPAAAAGAQTHDGHGGAAAQRHKPNPKEGTLIAAVRDATERFRNPADAMAEGYALQFGCVSGGEFGAMGLHFVNGALVGDGALDPSRPEIVLYEPLPNGRMRLTGADYLVLKADWDAKHPAPPELMGQLFHLIESPNRYGLPAFYTLHVWAWKENPSGAFSNWNPAVSCSTYSTQAP